MVMDILGPSASEAASSGLTITAAFTTVLTSAYTPNYGQISCINPEYLVFLNGADNSINNSQIAIMDSEGVTQDTFEFSGSTVGAFFVRAACADNDATYVIGTDGNDIIIGSFEHDFSAANWGRKLNYGQTVEEEVGIAVSDGFVYFTVKHNNIDTVVGQLTASTGVLQWDKSLGGNTGPLGIRADANGCYIAWLNPDTTGYFGLFAIDTTGAKRWQKVMANAFGTSGPIFGFDIMDDYVYVGGRSQSSNQAYALLKLAKTDGELSGQVFIGTSNTINSPSTKAPPFNWLACGGGKIIIGSEASTASTFNVAVLDEDLNVETNMLRLGDLTNEVRCWGIAADNLGNWFVTGYRTKSGTTDQFITGVLEDGTASTGWGTISRTVSTPSYTISNGSNTLADLTPTTNASETITVSSPSDLATEAW